MSLHQGYLCEDCLITYSRKRWVLEGSTWYWGKPGCMVKPRYICLSCIKARALMFGKADPEYIWYNQNGSLTFTKIVDWPKA